MTSQLLRRAFVALNLILSIALPTPNLRAQSPGTPRAWGDNQYGKLGNGTSGGANGTPLPVFNLSSAVAAAAGRGHSLAVRSDGTGWAWGHNQWGQLGNGAYSDSSTPVPISGLTSIAGVSAGYGFSLAVRSDGAVWAWGANSMGEVGTGSTSPSTINTPAKVPGLARIVAVAAGESHSLALERYSCPVADPGISNFPAPPGPYCSKVWAWGWNGFGQLGYGNGGGSPDQSHTATPVVVPGSTGVVAIAAGAVHSMALKSDGTVWTWGGNLSGQLGNGTVQTSAPPAAVAGLSGVVAIAAGDSHSLALKSDGTVWAWGSSYRGQLGTGVAASYVPMQVPGVSGIVAIAAGGRHSLALKADGTVWGWGDNLYRQLGTGAGAGTMSSIPILIQNLPGAVAIASGSRADHSLAITKPLVGVNLAALNFGSILVGASSTVKNVTITNQGPDPATVSSIYLNGANAGDFTVTGPALPATLAAGGSLTVGVRFTPTAEGARSATLAIGHDGFGNGNSVSLSGAGMVPADLSVTQSAAVSGRQIIYTLNVRNNGAGQATNIVLQDEVPDQTQVYKMGTGCKLVSGIVKCDLGTLASGAQTTVTLTVNVTAWPSAQVLISNTASVSSAMPDPNSSNNFSTLDVMWSGEGDSMRKKN